MKYSEEIYSKAEAELKMRRIRAEQISEMRRAEIASKYVPFSIIVKAGGINISPKAFNKLLY